MNDLSAIVEIVGVLQLLTRKVLEANERYQREQQRVNDVLQETNLTLKNILSDMVKEKRNPTADEWEEIRSITDTLHHRIQSL